MKIKKRTMNRVLSILFALALVFGLTPFASVVVKAAIIPNISYRNPVINTETNAVSFVDAAIDCETLSSSVTTWDGTTESWFVVNEDITFDSRITVTGNVNLILCDGKTLTANKGIQVAAGNSLTIYGQTEGTGKLNAKVTPGALGIYPYDAGIGGDDGQSAGTITINGGIVEANAGRHAAGIGGGQDGAGGNIVINGGTVTAVGLGAAGNNGGAGIGGGEAGDGGTTIIRGGIVNATGGGHAAGIGGGERGAGGTITIYGGDVTANGGAAGAGIGGGYRGSGGTITINGGDVHAYGGSYLSDGGAGIGGGDNHYGGSITINGGTVYAEGGAEAAGIGGGDTGAAGNITINGGSITAIGGSTITGGGAGIGSGSDTNQNGSNIQLNAHPDNWITINNLNVTVQNPLLIAGRSLRFRQKLQSMLRRH